MLFQVIKQTAITIDGKIERIATVATLERWTDAMMLAMELEASYLGQTHNGRAIMFEVVAV